MVRLIAEKSFYTNFKIFNNEILDLVFIDSNKSIIGSVINGLNVHEPSTIFLESLDYLLISSSYDVEIFNSIFDKLDNNKVFFNVNNLISSIKNNIKSEKDIINKLKINKLDFNLKRNLIRLLVFVTLKQVLLQYVQIITFRMQSLSQNHF